MHLIEMSEFVQEEGWVDVFPLFVAGPFLFSWH
jgi:hypothetical protein